MIKLRHLPRSFGRFFRPALTSIVFHKDGRPRNWCRPRTPHSAISPKLDVNLLLHQCRGAMLRHMPPGAETILSAGCSGSWYFKWVEQCYGRVPKHIGIELYSPRPADLPANVDWIANSVSDMSGVASGTCDLVFSGQNIEHLWQDEIWGFMIEAARVIRPGGTLVIDSPNRTLTAELNWSHPEHVIEFTPSEMANLFALGGFDVTKMVGLWLCRDRQNGKVLPFDRKHPGKAALSERRR